MQIENTNVIIIHGAYGHPEENWFGWFKRHLQMQNIRCDVPSLPTPQGHNLDNWMQVFAESCEHLIHQNTIIIGHSLGATFLLRWLERYSGQIAIAVLVGVFVKPVGIQKFDAINASFYQAQFNWLHIQSKAKRIYTVFGDNDPYISTDEFEKISKKLAAHKIIIPGGGHLNAAAGYTQFPELLELLNFKE